MTIIDRFVEMTEGTPVPRLFRLWSAVAMVAGALERRVWVDVGVEPIYPNLFILLIAHPAVGKSLPISLVRKIWREAGDSQLYVAPDSTTKASFMDELARAVRVVEVDGETIQYHCLLVASPEFGNFMPDHDKEFLNALNTIYDAKDRYQETRRTSASVDIQNPCVTILAGTQPDFLTSILPKEAWGMGFTSRLVLIYSDEKQKIKLKRGGRDKKETFSEIVQSVRALVDLNGQFDWTDDAWNEFSCWYYDRDEEPKPQHPRLRHYAARRTLTVCKLIQVFAVAERPELVIEKRHVERALSTLIEAEEIMPQIFETMTGDTDQGELEDIIHWITHRFIISGQKPLSLTEVASIVQRKFPINKAQQVIEYMHKAGLIELKKRGKVVEIIPSLEAKK